MARRGWGGSVATALGVAAGTGAAQLGFGYGLGIINWSSAGGTRVEAAWVASLAWATWISATSVVAGAVCAHRLRGEDEEPGRTLRSITLAVAAGVGALITVLLVAVPARAARVPDTFSPETVAAGYAVVGLLAGLLLAAWALRSRAAAANLVATTGWLWLLAVVSVVDGVLSGRGLTTAQLGIWQISADSDRFWIRDYFYWPGALLALGSALVIGVLAARGSARLPERRIGAAASGAAGPILVALAYLLAVPRLAAIAPEQLSAHLIAPYAVIAGLGGSVLVAVLAQRAELRAAASAEVTLPRQRTDEPAELAAPEAAGDEVSVGDKPSPRRRLFGRRTAATAPTEPAAGRATTAAPGGGPSGDPVEPDATPATPSAASTGRGAKSATRDTTPANPGTEPATGRENPSSARVRATGGRGRAVPTPRKPSDSPDRTGESAGPVPSDGPATDGPAPEDAPGAGAKARRRNR
ncbi:hypothetical protein ACL02O_32270 [Micromonospora sp. MS34]|uniref:hypothetical protein n=1 Tax=Micromonospora sp. MS34 TaxID=3385971 RepID=UPI0039A04637